MLSKIYTHSGHVESSQALVVWFGGGDSIRSRNGGGAPSPKGLPWRAQWSFGKDKKK